MDLHVRAVGNVQESLLPVAREGDVPHRAGAARRVRDDRFLHERTVLLEHLNAVVLGIAHVDQAVVRQLGAEYWTSELLGWRATRLVLCGVGVVRLFAIRAPEALDRARRHVDYDHAVIARAVGDERLVGLRVEREADWAAEAIHARAVRRQGRWATA